MADINAIAKQFTEFYYSTFDSPNRASLQSLYRAGSMLYWEGQPCQGAVPITEKLTTLPFKTTTHKVSTLDVQPASTTEASLVVLVTGLLTVDDTPNPLQFTQLFHLIPENGSYYVLNDVFRLIYG